MEAIMRTTVVLDDELLEKAQTLTKSKRTIQPHQRSLESPY
ncbi:type II toxin-antitoxin system VapB family antitoxin [Methylotuvimicrobium sp. KM1]